MKYFDNSLRILATMILLIAIGVSYKNIPVWKLFLVKDFNSLDLSVLLSKEQNAMGNISEISGGSGLKRKTLNESFFNSLKLNEQVFGGDILITDSNTKTVVSFIDGSKLEMEPGSMVKLDFHNDKTGLLNIAKNPKVEVISGSVTGTGGKKDLKITNLKGENLTVSAHSSNTIQAQPVIKAPVKINSERLTKLNLPPPTPKSEVAVKPEPEVAPVVKTDTTPPALKIENKPKVEPRKIASVPDNISMRILDVEPPKIAGLKGLNSNIYKGEDIRNFYVDLKWEPVPSATGYNLEMFTDSGLTKPWFHVQTENNYYRLNQMVDGTVFYRVTAFHNKKPISKTKPQNITFNYNGPELKNPKTGTQLQSKEGVYYFTWEKTNFTDKYIIEISKDPEFNKIIKKEVENNFIEIPLISGNYYWRVYSKIGDTISKPSKINNLVIK